MRKTPTLLIAVLGVAAIVAPASAEARACGTHGTTDAGATIEVDADGAATCTFAEATASRFYAVDGVPRHLRVRGTRLTYHSSRTGSGWVFWRYSGQRHGRYAAVTITQLDPPSSPPPSSPTLPPSPSPPPSSPPSLCDPNYAGACLDRNAVDYDCLGGSGDGPRYTGRVQVVGTDHYRLDGDGDGIGCE
jgi:hypothetical protein